MDYVGLSWVEFIPLSISLVLSVTLFSITGSYLREIFKNGDWPLAVVVFLLISLVTGMPLLVSLIYGCLLPNSPDDAQCAAVIKASDNVVVVDLREKLPKTDSLIIVWDCEHFFVWKDGVELFPDCINRRRSINALRAIENQGTPEDLGKRQEIIKEILYKTP